MDTVKTLSAGVGGVSIWWIDLIHPMLQLAVSMATLVYIIIKTKNEFSKEK
tara:strand:+ start:1358 stop:1510 length:153 start_codon:yes stop_codon:yes gene_type:complete